MLVRAQSNDFLFLQLDLHHYSETNQYLQQIFAVAWLHDLYQKLALHLNIYLRHRRQRVVRENRSVAPEWPFYVAERRRSSARSVGG